MIYDLDGWELKLGTKAEDGSILRRPHIVWFGESVPNIEPAIDLVQQADILVIIGTSLAAYPAASLLHYAPAGCRILLIDPKIPESVKNSKIEFIEKRSFRRRENPERKTEKQINLRFMNYDLRLPKNVRPCEESKIINQNS